MQFSVSRNGLGAEAAGGGGGVGTVAPDAIDKEDSVEFCHGRAAVRAVRRKSFGAEDLVDRQASPCEIRVIQNGNETGFFSRHSLTHTITDAVQS